MYSYCESGLVTEHSITRHITIITYLKSKIKINNTLNTIISYDILFKYSMFIHFRKDIEIRLDLSCRRAQVSFNQMNTMRYAHGLCLRTRYLWVCDERGQYEQTWLYIQYKIVNRSNIRNLKPWAGYRTYKPMYRLMTGTLYTIFEKHQVE